MYLWLETEEFRFLNSLKSTRISIFLFFHRNNSIAPWGGNRIKELYQFDILYTFLQITKVFIWNNNLLELSTILICTYNKNSSVSQRELTLLCNSWIPAPVGNKAGPEQLQLQCMGPGRFSTERMQQISSSGPHTSDSRNQLALQWSVQNILCRLKYASTGYKNFYYFTPIRNIIKVNATRKLTSQEGPRYDN